MKEHEKEHIDAVVTLLYQKGYRQSFTIRVPQSGRPMRSGDLSRLLAYFFDCKTEHTTGAELITHAPYNPNIECRIPVAYTEKEGFKLKELFINHKQTKERRQLHFGHNQELPGSLTIEGLFPKPKPRDQFLKGKRFRP